MRPRSRRAWWAALGLALAVAALLEVGTVARRTLPAVFPPRVPVLAADARALGPVEEVAVTTEDGLLLRGWYVRSRNGAAVLLAHGHGANRTQLVPLAAPLVRAGFGALLLDGRDHGASGGDRCTLGWREQLDLHAAVDLLARRPEVAPGRIGLVGYSMGGLAGGLVAARDPRVRAVVLAATFGSCAEMMSADEHPWTAPIAWATVRLEGIDLAAVRLEPALCGLAPRPLLLVYGGADRSAPPELGRRLLGSACAPAALEIVPDADHRTLPALAGARLGPALVRFFEAGLAPPRAPPAPAR